MSQIEELQGRITAALERIGAGASALGVQDTGAIEALNAQLQEEQQVNAQLEERLSSLKASHEEALATQKAALDQSAEMAALKTGQAEQAAAMSRLDMDLQRLRHANDQLRDSNAALRKANEAGVGEPHLINSAMLAELESLRSARASDSAEVSAVLAKLTPLLAGAQNLTEGEDA